MAAWTWAVATAALHLTDGETEAGRRSGTRLGRAALGSGPESLLAGGVTIFIAVKYTQRKMCHFNGVKYILSVLRPSPLFPELLLHFRQKLGVRETAAPCPAPGPAACLLPAPRGREFSCSARLLQGQPDGLAARVRLVSPGMFPGLLGGGGGDGTGVPCLLQAGEHAVCSPHSSAGAGPAWLPSERSDSSPVRGASLHGGREPPAAPAAASRGHTGMAEGGRGAWSPEGGRLGGEQPDHRVSLQWRQGGR